MAAATYTLKTSAIIAPTDLARVFFAPRGEVGLNVVWTEEIWTLKNSLTFDQTQGAKTEVNVDQTTTAIAVKYASGTTTFTFRVPDMDSDIAAIFATHVDLANPGDEIGSGIQGETSWDTFVGAGFSLALKPVTDRMVMLIYTNGWGIIFPHCEMVGSLKKSGEDVWTWDITGTVLAGGGSNFEDADVIFLKPGTPA
jgi:hypothetical protein